VPSTASDPVTVYIAEDNPILLHGLKRALTENGYNVDTAVDGVAILELLKARPLPDILLLDVMMPGLSGVEVLDAVRAEPETAELPVMLITAAVEEVLPESSLRERRVEVLLKPFRIHELLDRIESNVASRRRRKISPGGVAGGV